MISRGGLIARACRGPILLITIGSLFALQQAGIASFERTWPLLIIVLGLLKLLERVFAPSFPYPNGPYPNGPPAGGPYGQAYPPTQPPPPGGLR